MFTLTLVTPEKKIVAGSEIEEVFVPAHRGELNILPGHAPLMTTLETGVLKYRLKGESTLHYVAISWGYAQVNPTGVNVLAETAERAEDIDLKRVDEALKNAQSTLASDQTPESIEKYRLKIARANVRKSVAQHGTTH
ncbi:MAG TPA: ATP synthase F1 subunit epsilon [Bdellovibrionales bacterium]|jgi:F-type H+-transporting ATPase subunit epsilon|nr:ATP synthase F1 subunit epsilon [Bdellovibrionales bacterium]